MGTLLEVAFTSFEFVYLVTKTNTSLHVAHAVLERQLNRGLLETDDADDRCFWFRRVIEDLEESPIDTRIADYIDILPSQTRIDKATIERMNALTEGKLLTKVRVTLI